MKLQKGLTKFSRIFEVGAVQKYVNFGSFLPKDAYANIVRSRQELSNEYVFAKIGFDAAENGPLKVCQQFAKVRKKKLE